MLFDLKPNNKMDQSVGLLHATVSDTYLRLKDLVRDMIQEEIDYKGPNGDLNSTAQLLRHLAVVDLHWVYRLKGEPISEEHKQIFGPMFDEHGRIPLVRGVSLEQLLHEYDQVQQMFESVCMELTDADLNRRVNYENGAVATIRWGIWHIADHSRYHQANIKHLKLLYKKYEMT
jgi:uncharacterized damage-inducible protein DinB